MRFEYARTVYGWDFSINASQGTRQYFAIWYLKRCDCGVYIFGKHFVKRLDH
jgi:hypothetical protein